MHAASFSVTSTFRARISPLCSFFFFFPFEPTRADREGVERAFGLEMVDELDLLRIRDCCNAESDEVIRDERCRAALPGEVVTAIEADVEVRRSDGRYVGRRDVNGNLSKYCCGGRRGSLKTNRKSLLVQESVELIRVDNAALGCIARCMKLISQSWSVRPMRN